MTETKPDTPPMIEVNHLTKYYGGQPAIQDLSFTVPHGEIVGFLGPNGAGKALPCASWPGFSPLLKVLPG